MFAHNHIDRHFVAHRYQKFIHWEEEHSQLLLWVTLIVLLSLMLMMTFLWVAQSSRIQIYDPMQLDDLFYPYMLSMTK